MTEKNKDIVKRTSKGLVNALFDSIDKLNSNEIDPEKARAISHTAKTIVSVASLELDFRKYCDDVKEVKALNSLAIEDSR